MEFVQPFCIAVTTTIPGSGESVVLQLDGDIDTSVASLFLSRRRVALLYDDGPQIDFVFGADIVTDSFVQLQICIQDGVATLYINCVQASQMVIGSTEALDSGAGSSISFFQHAITNDSLRFNVS